jgi:hypothetical protein
MFLITSAAFAAIPPDVFPAEEDWTALRCGERVAYDAQGDESDALGPGDIVGDDDGPAGYVAQDDVYLYFRMRLDDEPMPNNEPVQRGWAFLLDSDDDPDTYEVQILANGFTAQLEVYANTSTTLPDDPADPPDAPAAYTHPFSYVTSTGGEFLVVAVPWGSLLDLGIAADTEYRTWLATTGEGEVLDGDVACGGPGDGGPNGNGGTILEGGGGCATPGAGLGSLLVLGLLAGATRRR